MTATEKQVPIRKLYPHIVRQGGKVRLLYGGNGYRVTGIAGWQNRSRTSPIVIEGSGTQR